MSTQQAMQPAETKERVPVETTPKDRFIELLDRFEAMQRDVGERAFEFFRARGGEEGFGLTDWLKAETELLGPITVDMTMNETEVRVKAELPEFEAKDIEIFVEPKRLTIRGHRDVTEEKREDERVLTERSTREVFRRLPLPARVDPKTAAAKLDKGILTLTITRIEMPEPTKVEVKVE
jgi:HSP20 family molecular chaperone IbpA